MKRSLLLIAILVLIFSFQDVQSQSLRDRVKKAVFKEPVKIKSADDSTTMIEIDDATESSSAHFTQQGAMKAFGLTDNVPFEEAYGFDAYIQMQISSYKKNGKLDDEVVYDNYMRKSDADYAMEFKDEGDKSTIIFDTKNSTMLILSDSDGELTGFATSLDPEALAETAATYEDDTDPDPYNVKKTGNTKKILGYSCDEYLVEDETDEVHMWVSEELGKEMHKEWMNNQQAFGSMFTYAYGLNGMILEMEAIDKNNGKKSVMLVIKIDLNIQHTVTTGDYSVMSMRKKTEEEKQK